jgi:hypothetical protein
MRGRATLEKVDVVQGPGARTSVVSNGTGLFALPGQFAEGSTATTRRRSCGNSGKSRPCSAEPMRRNGNALVHFPA